MHCELGCNELVISVSALPSVLTGDSMNDLNVTASTWHTAHSSGSVRVWVKVTGESGGAGEHGAKMRARVKVRVGQELGCRSRPTSTCLPRDYVTLCRHGRRTRLVEHQRQLAESDAA